MDISQIIAPTEDAGRITHTAEHAQDSSQVKGAEDSGRTTQTAEHAEESSLPRNRTWTASEDAQLIELRGKGISWDDISKELHNRTPLSCRLHYQNYLEHREWDEPQKARLAYLYGRDMENFWSNIGREMAVPWRSAEAMHWELGQDWIARQAGYKPFHLKKSEST